MEFYERVSGARMHAAFYRPNEVDWSGFNFQFFTDLLFFLKNTYKSITEMFVILATNNI
jgi:NADH:ubiquinone oxidoreductase subunit D